MHLSVRGFPGGSDATATWETWVQSLGQEEDPLEKEMATLQSIPAWKIPWREEPGHSSQGHKELDMTEAFIEQVFNEYLLSEYI